LFRADKRLSIMPSIHDSSGGALLFWRIMAGVISRRPSWVWIDCLV
jgi:hypothetical protein